MFWQLHIPLRLLCGGLLFTCNAVMWTFLAKALRYSSSSTWTTVTTTASNFISSVSGLLSHSDTPLVFFPQTVDFFLSLLLYFRKILWDTLRSNLLHWFNNWNFLVCNVISCFPSTQAFLGQLIFGETQITLWWVGISLTFSGLLVLQRVSPQDGHQNAVAKNE